MFGIWIWGGASALYLLFRLWYDGVRRPLSKVEIDAFMAEAEKGPTAGHNDMPTLRAFLEADDGREFFMFNLVKFAEGEAPHPVTGAPTPARSMMNHYMKTFMPALLAKGGHPALAARKIAGYVDAWRVGPDPGWSIIGYMRYRSRRDMMRLVVDQRFNDIHLFKLAGTAETFSFPTRPVLMTLIGPRLWVGLVIALTASLAQIAALAL
jgi:hypothetical protein